MRSGLILGQRLSEIGLAPVPVTLGAGNNYNFVSTGAGTNTKTAWTAMLLSAPFSADGFFFFGIFPSGANCDHLLDVGIGGAGSEVAILSNFLHSGNAGGTGFRIYVPIPIAAGTRMSFRHQCSSGTQGVSAGVALARGGIYRAMRRAKATTFGANTGDSGGTSVDPGGSANTKGSYVSLGAISDPIDHVIVCLGAARNTARSNADQFLDIASGTSVRVADHYSFQSAGSDLIHPDYSQFDTVPFLPGDNLQARMASSITDATDRVIDVVVIGFSK